MDEARTYRLGRNVKVFGVLAALFILAVVTGVLVQILGGETPLEGVVFFFVWLALVLAMIAYQALRGITSITLERETITFRFPFDDFHDLLNRLKAMSPSIEIKRL